MSDGILVVGSDDSAIATLASVLRTLAVPVRVARDGGEEALAEATVVVVHGAPSGRSAIDLARAVRLRRGPAAPRMVWIPTGEPRRVELVHFDEVVRRPYRAIDLIERVRRLLRASGTHARAARPQRERGIG